MKRSGFRIAVAGCLHVGLVAALLAQPSTSLASSTLTGAPAALAARQSSSPGANAVADPAAQLGPGYRSSRDRAVTVAGDATGLHVLVADESDGYSWRTAATLAVPGTDTTQWIGQACVTGDGQRAVVVYGPRQITNLADAEGFTALAAIVNLGNGTVTSLGGGFSIAYFDPGCGTADQVVLTQGGWGGPAQPGEHEVTRLVLLNAQTGKTVFTVTEPGQVTSTVPYQGQIAATYGPGVVAIDAGGRVRTLAPATAAAFRLTPDSAGGLGFQVMAGSQVRIHRFAAGRDQLIGAAPAGSVELQEGGGRVWLTGPHAAGLGRLPAQWHAVDVPALSPVSTTGALAVTSVLAGGQAGRRGAAAAPDVAQPVRIGARVMATGKQVTFTVPAANPAPVGALAPAAGGNGSKSGAGGNVTKSSAPHAAAVNPATVTYDPDRTCSVPRNDPKVQTYQPSAKQVEWAADQAVQGDLTGTRGPDLYGSGLPAYTPQGMFPIAPGLSGGGTVPAQILLGVLTQESNLDQASSHAIIGQTGNVLPSYNWYGNWVNDTNGVPQDTGLVNWSNVDCGYGIAQVTTGMCMSGNTKCPSADGSALPPNDQLAVAIDYQANIAAGLQVLEKKWNELYSLGIKANDANPRYIENWWFALWDYNSGLEPNASNGNTTGCSPSPSCHDSAGNWGLGWANNPANNSYAPDRPQFLSSSSAATPDGQSYSDAWDQAHPNYWSYEEKVIGFAFNAFTAYSFVGARWEQAYAYGLWPGTPIQTAEPSLTALCVNSGTTNDHCNPNVIDASAATQTADPCQQTGSVADHCWWHWPLTWTSCSATCGTQVLTYSAHAADPGNPGAPPGYSPACSNSPLPSNAVIVGDTASSIPAPLGCGESWSNNGGTMTWQFGAAAGSPATYPSKIDFHQIGAGYSGHFWVTHTIPSDQTTLSSPNPALYDAQLAITGTWTPPSSVTGWTRIMVAIPNEGAWDPQANYQISLGNGTTQYRVVNQAYQSDTWVDLGIYPLAAGAKVSLSNATYSGLGYDIAWDAAAFIPASSPTTDYVAMGDSYSSGEGLLPFNLNSDYNYAGQVNTCHRSSAGSYADFVTLPGQSTPIAKQASGLTGADQFTFTACSGAESPAITESAVDGSSSQYLRNDPNESTYQQWDSSGYTDWTSGSAIFGGGSQTNIGNFLTPHPVTVGSTGKELPQADQGWLGPQTTLVTLTIGGNDARFPDVMTACSESAFGGGDCSDPSYYLTRLNGHVDPQPLYQFEPQVIKGVKSHLAAAYAAVAAAAPNAEIIVLGYPRLFPGDQNPTSTCEVTLGIDLGVPTVAFLNQMGDLLDQQISGAVAEVKATGVNIHYVDANSAFSGHEICGAAPWFGGIVNEETSGSGTSAPGNDSFHPTAAGQQAYAKLVDDCLAGTINC